MGNMVLIKPISYGANKKLYVVELFSIHIGVLQSMANLKVLLRYNQGSIQIYSFKFISHQSSLFTITGIRLQFLELKPTKYYLRQKSIYCSGNFSLIDHLELILNSTVCLSQHLHLRR